MAASHNDSFQLSQDSVFQNRVQAALLSACVAISNEGWTIAFHRERSQFCSQILANTNSNINYVILFTNAVATDSNILSDATQAGTVVLTPANRAAQAALVTDAHIDTAISSMFNSFIREPAN
jgi:hypothetical protein